MKKIMLLLIVLIVIPIAYSYSTIPEGCIILKNVPYYTFNVDIVKCPGCDVKDSNNEVYFVNKIKNENIPLKYGRWKDSKGSQEYYDLMREYELEEKAKLQAQVGDVPYNPYGAEDPFVVTHINSAAQDLAKYRIKQEYFIEDKECLPCEERNMTLYRGECVSCEREGKVWKDGECKYCEDDEEIVDGKCIKKSDEKKETKSKKEKDKTAEPEIKDDSNKVTQELLDSGYGQVIYKEGMVQVDDMECFKIDDSGITRNYCTVAKIIKVKGRVDVRRHRYKGVFVSEGNEYLLPEDDLFLYPGSEAQIIFKSEWYKNIVKDDNTPLVLDGDKDEYYKIPEPNKGILGRTKHIFTRLWDTLKNLPGIAKDAFVEKKSDNFYNQTPMLVGTPYG